MRLDGGIMKRRRILSLISLVVLCVALLLCLAACPPMSDDLGVTVCGLTINGVSRVELKSVEFKYNITSYPKLKDGYPERNDAYVTAIYDFANESSQDIIMPLYIPTGEPNYYFETQSDDSSRYSFVSDAKHEVVLRCLYDGVLDVASDSDNNVKVQAFLKSLYDDKQVDSRFTVDMPVYKYEYTVNNLKNDVKYLRLQVDRSNSNIVFVDREICESDNINGYSNNYVEIAESDTLTVYSLQNELANVLTFCDRNCQTVENGGDVTLASSGTFTFDEFVMFFIDAESNLSPSDWFNAVVAHFNSAGFTVKDTSFFELPNMSYMYQCNLTVPARGEAIIAVNIPLYPTVDRYSYSAPVYEYTMDFSALRNWNGLPQISVSVATDGYYVKSSCEINETSNGFELVNPYISSRKTSFTISDNPNFDKKESNNDGSDKGLIALCISLGVLALIPAVATWVVLGCDRAKKRKKAEQKEKEETTTTEL